MIVMLHPVSTNNCSTVRCGIRLNEDEHFDASEWRGQNILGFALMEVRSMLRKVED